MLLSVLLVLRIYVSASLSLFLIFLFFSLFIKRPNSFASDLFHTYLVFGSFIRCLYSLIFTVSMSSTAFTYAFPLFISLSIKACIAIFLKPCGISAGWRSINPFRSILFYFCLFCIVNFFCYLPFNPRNFIIWRVILFSMLLSG